VVEEKIDDGRFLPVGDLGRVAADGGADYRENSRPDDDTDAEGGERDGAERFFEGVLGALGVGDELVDGLGGEDLAGQGRVLVGGIY
jgi:hypothetical protein